MINKEVQVPLFARFTLILIGLFVFFIILYITRSILIPLVFATIIAIVLHPAVNWLTRLKINRIIAITIVFLIASLILWGFGTLIVRQVQRVSESWPVLSEKFNSIFTQNIADASVRYDVDPQKIHDWIATAKAELISRGSEMIGQSLVVLGNGLVILFLIPVYVFMLLFYHPLLHDFIFKLFSESSQGRVSKMVTQTKIVIQRYLVGLVFEFIIVATLNSTALLILGIPYAILLGILGALLNVIPYIGGLVAVALPMMIALATKDSA